MSVPVFNSQPVLQACVLEAVQHSPALLAQLLAAASQSLSDQAQSSSASASARQQAGDALCLLQAHEATLHRAYPLALLECFAQDRVPGSGSTPPRSSSAALLNIDSLSLVDEKEHHAQVELRCAQEQVTHATDAVLAELNALVSAAQGLPRVQVERNPLRPENYLRALQRVLKECADVPAAVRETWMQHLLPALGGALREVYQQTSQILRQQGIVPVGYSVASSRYGSSQYGPSSHGAGLAQASLNEQAAQAQEDALTASILHQLLQGGADPYSTSSPTWELPGGSTLYSGMSPLHPAVQAAQVVAQMMDNIAQDGRLLPAVRQILQGMEPAVGQLAGHDSTFFSNPQHPARRLLDEVTERSLTLEADNTPTCSRFIALLQQINLYLAQQDTRQSAPFATALQILEQTYAQWAQQDKLPQVTPTTAVGRSNPCLRLSQEVAANIRKLPNIGLVPTDIMQFATGPWAQVIAKAQLAQPDSRDGDPHGYLALVPLLFWSVRPGIAIDERRQITQAVPEMLHTLQHGLTRFGYPAQETDRFLARLQQLHRQTLASASPPVPSHASMVARSPAPVVQASPDVDIELDIELESAHGIPAELAAIPNPVPAAAVVAHGDFSIGTWFELQSNRQAMRTQLTWASPKGTLFLFTGSDGSTQSMTRRIRDRLLTEGTLRPLPAP